MENKIILNQYISAEKNISRAVHIIAGPTATGKTSAAIELAIEHNGVIINADSMQIYNALPILSAQPSRQEQAAAPHRLYSHFEPNEKCSVDAWQKLALAEIALAHSNGQLPIIVGGTGFYIKALIEGLSTIPSVPAEIRQDAEEILAEIGNQEFHQRLLAKDPVMGERLHPNDSQRIIRAWEVLETTGKSLSYWQKQPNAKPPEHLVFSMEILNPPREILRDRCNRRFDLMLTSGVMEEIEELDERISNGGLSPDAPITHALGFHPLQSYIHGELLLEEAVDQAKTETRQYAKRQVTWFKNQFTEPYNLGAI